MAPTFSGRSDRRQPPPPPVPGFAVGASAPILGRLLPHQLSTRFLDRLRSYHPVHPKHSALVGPLSRDTRLAPPAGRRARQSPKAQFCALHHLFRSWPPVPIADVEISDSRSGACSASIARPSSSAARLSPCLPPSSTRWAPDRARRETDRPSPHPRRPLEPRAPLARGSFFVPVWPGHYTAPNSGAGKSLRP